jgi:hypothetical protein
MTREDAITATMLLVVVILAVMFAVIVWIV